MMILEEVTFQRSFPEDWSQRALPKKGLSSLNVCAGQSFIRPAEICRSLNFKPVLDSPCSSRARVTSFTWTFVKFASFAPLSLHVFTWLLGLHCKSGWMGSSAKRRSDSTLCQVLGAQITAFGFRQLYIMAHRLSWRFSIL